MVDLLEYREVKIGTTFWEKMKINDKSTFLGRNIFFDDTIKFYGQHSIYTRKKLGPGLNGSYLIGELVLIFGPRASEAHLRFQLL